MVSLLSKFLSEFLHPDSDVLARHTSQPDVYKTDFIKHKTVALAPIKFEHLWNCKEKEEPNHLKCKLCFKEFETKSVHLNLQPSVHFNSFWHTDKWREGTNKPKCNCKENIGFDEFPLFVRSVTRIYNPMSSERAHKTCIIYTCLYFWCLLLTWPVCVCLECSVFSVCDNIFNDGVWLTWHPGLHLPVPLCLIIAEIMLNNDSCYSPYTGCPLQATRRNCGEQLTHKQHPPLEQTLPYCPNHKSPFKQIFNSQSLINIFTMFTQYTKLCCKDTHPIEGFDSSHWHIYLPVCTYSCFEALAIEWALAGSEH